MAISKKQRQIVKMKGDLAFFTTTGLHIRSVIAAIPMATAVEGYFTAMLAQKLLVAGASYLLLAVVHSLVNRRIMMLRTEIQYLETKLELGP